MPKALGQFGKSKHSDITHKVLDVIQSADKPLKLNEIWIHVSNDLEKISILQEIMMNLGQAGKIQSVLNQGFLPKKKAIDSTDIAVDFSLLTDEERGMRI